MHNIRNGVQHHAEYPTADQTMRIRASVEVCIDVTARAISHRVTTSVFVVRQTTKAMPVPINAPGNMAANRVTTVKRAYALLWRGLFP
jgi:hypothetical protein